jgi:hypothetical protein
MADNDAEVAELQANLREYREQMEQVRGATSCLHARRRAHAPPVLAAAHPPPPPPR